MTSYSRTSQLCSGTLVNYRAEYATSHKTKNQYLQWIKEVVTMLNHIDKQHSISHKDGAFECMCDLFSYICIENIEDVLRDNLKSDMGNDKLSGKHSALETNHQISNITFILKFLRTFPHELSVINIMDDEALQSIQNAFNEFNYEDTDEIILNGLKNWIFQDEDSENACIEYAFRISTVYNQARALLKMCWNYYQHIPTINYEAKK